MSLCVGTAGGPADDLTAAAERSTAEGERMAEDVAWIRSYVLAESDSTDRHVLHLSGIEPRGDPQARRCGGPAGRRNRDVADTVSCDRTRPPSRPEEGRGT